MTKLFKIYNKKKIIITGHTGFKGSWLTAWLNYLGADVLGLSNSLPSKPCNFKLMKLSNFISEKQVDVSDYKNINSIIKSFNPDFIFHLAAQSLVRRSYENPLNTINSNVIGSINILESLRGIKKKVSVVMITSDKVYHNIEKNYGYREEDLLGGLDPYSASKTMAEFGIKSYLNSYFSNSLNCNTRIGIARAGNVIGGGDWAEDRLVPDCIKAWSNNKIVKIRYPHSTRPWQHVLEPLSGYLALGADLYENSDNHAQAFNFGPFSNQDHTVKDLINEMSKYWSKCKWQEISTPKNKLHEAGLLKLNCNKAKKQLKWIPTLNFEETVKFTIEWYLEYYNNTNKPIYDFTINQIKDYTKLAINRSIRWASLN